MSDVWVVCETTDGVIVAGMEFDSNGNSTIEDGKDEGHLAEKWPMLIYFYADMVVSDNVGD